MPPGTTRSLVQMVFILPEPPICNQAGRHSLERLVGRVMKERTALLPVSDRKLQSANAQPHHAATSHEP
jgi:hypothetical protein